MLASKISTAVTDDPHRELTTLFQAQREAFAQAPFTSLAQRRAMLRRLLKAVVARTDEYTTAVNADFGNRHADETVISELLTFAESVRYARAKVRRWMKHERRSAGFLMAGNRCEVHHQPLGVVGIMAPWNYPFLMVMRPLVCALAAGNRVLVKPSEITPRTAAFLTSLFEEVFPDGEVRAVNGDARLAAAFSALPFDHILFTGSTEVGRHVMRAAAENLTPVTLELGGKSPTLIGPDANIAKAARRISFGKAINAGQTCVAPDYVLVPRAAATELEQELASSFDAMFPDVAHNDHYTSIVDDRQHARLQALLEDARSKGASVTVVGGEQDGGVRKFPLTLINNVTHDMRVMQEEIFGPLLPLVPYDDVNEAIEYIKARPRALSLMLFTHDKSLKHRVVNETHSGAVSVNDALTYVAVDDLPFGGVGASGMGKYMGREGFLTFSHSKTVFVRPTLFNSARLLYAPYGTTVLRWLRALILR